MKKIWTSKDFQRWGRKGGKKKSQAKTLAAQANIKKRWAKVVLVDDRK